MRADRNTGLVELLAIIAIFRPRGLAAPPPVSGAGDPHAAGQRGERGERSRRATLMICIVRRPDQLRCDRLAPAASRRSANRALAWSSTTAMIIAQPMMIHS